MYNNEIGIYSRKRFHYQSSAVHSRAPLTPSRRPIFSPGGAGQDTARTWGASPVCTRVIPHNARWWARRARETVTTLQWADTRPGRRRVRGWHSRCPGWWLMRMTLALFFVLAHCSILNDLIILIIVTIYVYRWWLYVQMNRSIFMYLSKYVRYIDTYLYLTCKNGD